MRGITERAREKHRGRKMGRRENETRHIESKTENEINGETERITERQR